MNIKRLRATLERDEGLNLKRHEVQGIDHIGYGINLENELPGHLLEYLGVEDEDDIEEITQEQADYLLDYFADRAEKDCITIYGGKWESLSPLRKEVLINLSFNLGLSRLKAFRKMNAAIRVEDWAEASAQMLDSKAAKQTGERYPRLAKAFESNAEAYLELPKSYDAVPDRIPAPEDDSPLAAFTDHELLRELGCRMGLDTYTRQLDDS